jgi:hypothetical protein
MVMNTVGIPKEYEQGFGGWDIICLFELQVWLGLL